MTGYRGIVAGSVVRSKRDPKMASGQVLISRSCVARRTQVFKPKVRQASQRIFKCTWKGCGVIYTTCSEITAHVRNAHLGPRKPNEYSDEEDFFFTETEDESDESAPNPPSPPTLSHRDMARPPHEDPEYQRQIVGNYRQGLLSQSQALAQQQHQQQQQQQAAHQQQAHQSASSIKPPLPAGITVAALSSGSNGTSNGTGSTAATAQQHHQQQLSHIQLSPGSSSSTGGSAGNGTSAAAAAYQQLLAGAGAGALGSYSSSGSSGSVASTGGQSQQHRSPVSPNRRTRGENKKCRKVYGMDHKDQWCTQCKWKKACTRFGD
ncbi:zinc finger protein 395 [Anopheles darlingi]|uniref:Zinc finger protein 395 n=1 Tax=Anopheles darlingi TaxID=43151 RepID=W5JDV5_ANODA|nr:zinc finger protein 395 [Anopheles darlingi]